VRGRRSGADGDPTDSPRTQDRAPRDPCRRAGHEVRQPDRHGRRRHRAGRSCARPQRVEWTRTRRPRTTASLSAPAGGASGSRWGRCRRRGVGVTETPRFKGYRRPNGQIGVRNHLLVVPTVICSSVVAERIAASVPEVGAALPHLAGCGQLGPDLQITHDTLAAYCRHPNVGAVIVVALGCEQVIAQHLAATAKAAGKPIEIIAIQTEGGTVRATARGVDVARAMAADLEGAEREWCSVESLTVAVKCGGSDYTSGLAANPVLGRV